MFAEASATTSFWCMGLNQRIRGVWANNLVSNLHLLTGHIGKTGASPFSLTGQPNACGGVRDTGSLCHLLPAGRLIKKPEHRAKLEEQWGLKPGTLPQNPGCIPLLSGTHFLKQRLRLCLYSVPILPILCLM